MTGVAAARLLPSADLCNELEALADREAGFAARRAAAGRLRRSVRARAHGRARRAAARGPLQRLADEREGGGGAASRCSTRSTVTWRRRPTSSSRRSPTARRRPRARWPSTCCWTSSSRRRRGRWGGARRVCRRDGAAPGRLRRMWASVFGRLPAASERALAYAPRSAAERCRAGGKGALLVPPPPSVQAVPSAQATPSS